MAYELIITEKPNAAKKIADALADGKAIKKSNNGAPYYDITHKGKDIMVSCAVGHLYTVAEKDKKGWTYPVFNVEWVPNSTVDKKAKFSAKYLTTIKKLCKDAKEITVATDYDIEGEVIGLNIIKYACKKKDARRMKFSTLTKDELIRSYENASDHLDWGQANAGETRHILDYYYGINLSRALSLSVKAAGSFKILSSGRVQGPALKIIVEKEKEIKAFVPVPFWHVELTGKAKERPIIALHEEDKFWEKKDAEKVMKKVKGQKAIVDKVERKQYQQAPPTPFDLTTLQTEAYRSMKISPKETLALAQELYTKGLISYPRTSSQKLPKEIGYKKIIESITRQDYYRELCEKLLAKPSLQPHEGKKADPAHPAIYPTGQISHIADREAKIYDLIVRRFLATFGDPATRETMTINIDVNKENFITKGTRTVEKGWHIFYGHHVKIEEEELPPVVKGEEIKVEKIDMLDKETQPPRRYTPASIIRELERRGLGTKATRASIVDALYNRGYVHEKSIQATELGIRVCEILEKYSPTILDEELTRKFEEDMDKIREHKEKGQDVLDKAEKLLNKILIEFKKREKEIGTELSKAYKETRDEMSYVGPCHNCKDGTLQIRKGKFGRFIACDKYPDCKTTFSLPARGLIKSLKKDCEQCKFPMISIQMARKRPQEVCINPKCPSKQVSEEEKKHAEKPCPKCGEGTMVLKKSVYGTFLACNRYPKCRNTESLHDEHDESHKKDEK